MPRPKKIKRLKKPQGLCDYNNCRQQPTWLIGDKIKFCDKHMPEILHNGEIQRLIVPAIDLQSPAGEQPDRVLTPFTEADRPTFLQPDVNFLPKKKSFLSRLIKGE